MEDSNEQAALRTVEELRRLDLLTASDDARVAAFLSLARAVDEAPSNAALWREYRAAEENLRDDDDGPVDEFAALLGRLSATVGDKTAGQGDVGGSDSEGG
jgi:hypothetical protein